MTTRAYLILAFALVAVASLNSPTAMRAQTGRTDFVMVSSSFSPAYLKASKGKETAITFNQETRVDAPTKDRCGVLIRLLAQSDRSSCVA